MTESVLDQHLLPFRLTLIDTISIAVHRIQCCYDRLVQANIDMPKIDGLRVTNEAALDVARAVFFSQNGPMSLLSVRRSNESRCRGLQAQRSFASVCWCEVIVGTTSNCLPTSVPVLPILLRAILYFVQYLYSFLPIVRLFCLTRYLPS